MKIFCHLLSVVLLSTTLFFGCATKPVSQSVTRIELPTPERPSGVTDVVDLRCAPIDTVRVGFIGLGMRGPGAVGRFTNIEGVEIVALCDLHEDRVKRCQKYLTNAGMPEADEYFGSEDSWKKLCERDDIDLVYICTDWATHTPMSLYAMEQGKHVACEVPIAVTVEECWQLVDMAEKTKRHCMMLENCCYDFYEMMALNMAQQGVLGEIVHAEGAYIHDLRHLNFLDPKKGGYDSWWRLEYNRDHDGNGYATHGLGPVCQSLNIGRGDRMTHLVSMSSGQFGMTDYAEETFGKDSELAKTAYKKGDMNTTMIKTENGKTIMIQHDVTSPRPYNRKYALSGTKGYMEKYPRPGIALEKGAVEFEGHENLNGHSFLSKELYDQVADKYEHRITKEIGEQAKKVGGHGGMDFIMDYRLIYCLRNGLPLDMNVYDGAEWSCLGELTEISIENGNAPVAIPDFTRGAWKKLKKYEHHYAN